MNSFLRSSAAILVALPALVTGAFAQDSGSAQADMMTVYTPGSDGGEGSTREVSLEEAAEACGVDLHFIEAWAQSEPRYCVAVGGETDGGASAAGGAQSNSGAEDAASDNEDGADAGANAEADANN